MTNILWYLINLEFTYNGKTFKNNWCIQYLWDDNDISISLQ